MVEYALVAALVVVGSLAAIQFVERESREETAQQVECIAERPPPPGCQIPVVLTTTTSTPGSTDPPPPPAPVGLAVWDDSAWLSEEQPPGSGNWVISGALVLGIQDTDDVPAEPIEGAVVQFEVFVPGFGSFSGGSCVSDADGNCEMPPFSVSFPVDQVTVAVSNITSDPLIDSDEGYPASHLLVRP